jgi:hypothetical protein
MKELTIENLQNDDAPSYGLLWITLLLERGGPTPDDWASMPHFFSWAIEHGYIPRTDEMREAACRDCWTALEFAEYVDKEPRDDTRTAACRDSIFAYRYARKVDKKPTHETREAVKGYIMLTLLYADWEKSL